MSEDKTPPEGRKPTSRAKRISELFQQACELNDEQREALLNRACAGDAELRAEVKSLLAHDATGVLGTESLTEQIRGMHAELEVDPHPARVGPYKILEVLGEGGMGIVYVAEQETPVRRRVAVKVIKWGMDTKQVVARFEAERQALAMMNHPNVAKVFDAGATEQGRPYFAMELVKGESITKHCDRQRLTTQERLELFMQVCEGVQHAHQKGIIHRDIKPSNILVQTEDDKRIPKIIDFGVAKATQQRLTERTLFTEQGVMIGTPEYMSPEQAEMTVEDIDTRTDVYSLGVLLYELLVGALPFDPKELRQAGFDEIRRKIREDEPSKPSTRLSTLGEASSESAKRRRTDLRTLRRQLSGDLDWITMRALEKDRTRRYGSPQELAADIRRYQAREPVLAGPRSVGYRMGKFASRHKAALLAVGGIILALSIGLIFSESQRREAVRQRAVAVHQSYVANLLAASASSESGEVREAIRRLELCDEEHRSWEWYFLRFHCDRSLVTYGGHDRPVITLAADATSGTLVTGSSDGVLRIRDLTTGRLRNELRLPDGHTPTRTCTAVGMKCVSVRTDEVVVYDLAAKRVVARWKTNHLGACEGCGAVSTIALSPDGKLVATGGNDGMILVWSTESGRLLDSLTAQVIDDPKGGRSNEGVWTFSRKSDEGVSGLTFGDDGMRLAAATGDGYVKIWDLATREVVFSRHEPELLPYSGSAVRLRGKYLAYGIQDIRIWNIEENEEVQTFRGHMDRVECLAFSNEGTLLVTGSNDQTLRVWNIESGDLLHTLIGHDDAVLTCAFAPESGFILSGSADGTAKVWQLGQQRRLGIKTGMRFFGPLARMALSRDGQVVAAPDIGPEFEHNIAVWDSIRGSLITRVSTAEYVSAVEFLPSGNNVVIAANGHRLLVVDFDRGEVVDHWEAHDGRIVSLAVSPDGFFLASASADKTIKVWDLRTREVIRVLNGHGGTVHTVTFDPSGALLASASADKTVKLWNVETGELVSTLSAHSDEVYAVSFSSSGRQLLTGSRDETARVWYLDAAEPHLTLQGLRGGATAVAFGVGDTRLVTGASDGTIRVWDSRSGEHLLTLGHGRVGAVQALVFSVDGSSLISQGGGGIRSWETGLTSRQSSEIGQQNGR